MSMSLLNHRTVVGPVSVGVLPAAANDAQAPRAALLQGPVSCGSQAVIPGSLGLPNNAAPAASQPAAASSKPRLGGLSSFALKAGGSCPPPSTLQAVKCSQGQPVCLAQRTVAAAFPGWLPETPCDCRRATLQLKRDGKLLAEVHHVRLKPNAPPSAFPCTAPVACTLLDMPLADALGLYHLGWELGRPAGGVDLVMVLSTMPGTCLPPPLLRLLPTGPLATSATHAAAPTLAHAPASREAHATLAPEAQPARPATRSCTRCMRGGALESTAAAQRMLPSSKQLASLPSASEHEIGCESGSESDEDSDQEELLPGDARVSPLPHRDLRSSASKAKSLRLLRHDAIRVPKSVMMAAFPDWYPASANERISVALQVKVVGELQPQVHVVRLKPVTCWRDKNSWPRRAPRCRVQGFPAKTQEYGDLRYAGLEVGAKGSGVDLVLLLKHQQPRPAQTSVAAVAAAATAAGCKQPDEHADANEASASGAPACLVMTFKAMQEHGFQSGSLATVKVCVDGVMHREVYKVMVSAASTQVSLPAAAAGAFQDVCHVGWEVWAYGPDGPLAYLVAVLRSSGAGAGVGGDAGISAAMAIGSGGMLAAVLSDPAPLQQQEEDQEQQERRPTRGPSVPLCGGSSDSEGAGVLVPAPPALGSSSQADLALAPPDVAVGHLDAAGEELAHPATAPSGGEGQHDADHDHNGGQDGGSRAEERASKRKRGSAAEASTGTGSPSDKLNLRQAADGLHAATALAAHQVVGLHPTHGTSSAAGVSLRGALAGDRNKARAPIHMMACICTREATPLGDGHSSLRLPLRIVQAMCRCGYRPCDPRPLALRMKANGVLLDEVHEVRLLPQYVLNTCPRLPGAYVVGWELWAHNDSGDVAHVVALLSDTPEPSRFGRYVKSSRGRQPNRRSDTRSATAAEQPEFSGSGCTSGEAVGMAGIGSTAATSSESEQQHQQQFWHVKAVMVLKCMRHQAALAAQLNLGMEMTYALEERGLQTCTKTYVPLRVRVDGMLQPQVVSVSLRPHFRLPLKLHHLRGHYHIGWELWERESNNEGAAASPSSPSAPGEAAQVQVQLAYLVAVLSSTLPPMQQQQHGQLKRRSSTGLQGRQGAAGEVHGSDGCRDGSGIDGCRGYECDGSGEGVDGSSDGVWGGCSDGLEDDNVQVQQQRLERQHWCQAAQQQQQQQQVVMLAGGGQAAAATAAALPFGVPGVASSLPVRLEDGGAGMEGSACDAWQGAEQERPGEEHNMAADPTLQAHLQLSSPPHDPCYHDPAYHPLAPPAQPQPTQQPLQQQPQLEEVKPEPDHEQQQPPAPLPDSQQHLMGAAAVDDARPDAGDHIPGGGDVPRPPKRRRTSVAAAVVEADRSAATPQDLQHEGDGEPAATPVVGAQQRAAPAQLSAAQGCEVLYSYQLPQPRHLVFSRNWVKSIPGEVVMAMLPGWMPLDSSETCHVGLVVSIDGMLQPEVQHRVGISQLTRVADEAAHTAPPSHPQQQQQQLQLDMTSCRITGLPTAQYWGCYLQGWQVVAVQPTSKATSNGGSVNSSSAACWRGTASRLLVMVLRSGQCRDSAGQQVEQGDMAGGAAGDGHQNGPDDGSEEEAGELDAEAGAPMNVDAEQVQEEDSIDGMQA